MHCSSHPFKILESLSIPSHLTTLALSSLDNLLFIHSYLHSNFHYQTHCCGMEGRIDGNASLDYATIQIFPGQNRYEVFVCGGDEVEKLAVGALEELLPHSPGVSNLHAKGSNAIFKLQVMGEKPDPVWFTKSTLHRFLRIVGCPKLLNTSKVIEGEISQLEEARKFHFSLYAQGKDGNSKSGKIDEFTPCSTPESAKPEEKIASSDTSKSELLQAMDLRLTALRRDFAANLNQAAGAPCLSKEIRDLISFCEYFGAASLQVSLCRFLTLTQNVESTVISSQEIQVDASVTTSDKVSEPRGDNHTGSKSDTHKDHQTGSKLHSETPVKYGVSPAMLAKIERESSTESEGEFSDSSNDHLCASRNRSVTRCAPPRRSASPMRRIQIGRNGSRRAAALTIKTLASYPARERLFSKGDFSPNDSEGEGSEQSARKPENDVRRMSVQDAISLFESKQKDQTDTQKNCSLSNASLSKNKSVLRRWSAGVTECSNSCQSEIASTDSDLLCCKVENKEILKHSSGQVEFNTPECQDFVEPATVDVEMEKEKEAHDPVAIEAAVNKSQNQGLESKGRSAPSTDWCEQKKVELEKMLLKMREYKPVKNNSRKNKNTASEQRGGFYDPYKEKRNEKLRGENAGKRAEKAAQFRAMQQTLDQRKAEITSKGVKDVSKKLPSPKPQKPLKNQSQLANHRIESPKTSVAKVSKTSVPPPSRKSWPSTSSTRAAGISPAKSPAGLASSGPAPTRRKPQSTPSLPPSSVKTENSRPQRNPKSIHTSGNNNLKGVKDKQQPLKKGTKTKAEAVAAAGDSSDLGPSKTRFYNRTKKSSVVPIEAKPYLRKRSGNVTGTRPSVNKINHSCQLEESSLNCNNTIESKENALEANSCVPVSEHHDRDVGSLPHNAAVDLEAFVESSQHFDETEKFDDLGNEVDEGFKGKANCSEKNKSQEESIISSVTWVEAEEQSILPSSNNDTTSQSTSPVHAAFVESPRIRHSLSQMLQEESEPETAEWGNCEIAPASMYQKDAPKGLKRLLKFARKSKGDANSNGCSSPSVFSEGEDDGEESKAIRKRNSDLLRKATLQQNSSGSNMDALEFSSAQSNLSRFTISHKLQEGQATAKGSRSFFSLSAFRASKPN